MSHIPQRFVTITTSGIGHTAAFDLQSIIAIHPQGSHSQYEVHYRAGFSGSVGVIDTHIAQRLIPLWIDYKSAQNGASA